jgi:hypothetical protein
MISPITFFTGTTNVTSGVINITIPNFRDGDVYYVTMNSTSIGIKETTLENDFRIYPNPSSSSITIIAKEAIKENLVIENALGQRMQTQRINGNRVDLNIEDLPIGIYFIKVGSVTKKIIKN